MSSADVWKYRDSVLGCEDCLAANSKSTGPPQKSADDQNCSVNSAVRPTSAEWQNADVDGQWLLLWLYNCPSSTAEQFHGDIDTWALRAQIVLDQWHQASGARHALIVTNHCRTSECQWQREQLNSSLSATCLLWLSATQPTQRYSSRHEMSQMLARGF